MATDRQRGAVAAAAEQRLCALARDRGLIRTAVNQRVCAGVPRHALGAVLGDVAREEGELAAVAERRAYWRDLGDAARVAGEARRDQLLAEIVDLFVEDIAGGFDARVYRLVMQFLGATLDVVAPLQTEGPIDELRALADRGTLVFAPTHSSNLDSLVLGLALRRAALPPCVYAAGVHLYRNRVLGVLMSKLGGYRVDRRRQVGLYKDVLKEYCAVLLERGYHSVIFPGATRCRSNEVEPSVKLGLLGTVARADQHGGRRIHVVPVTINYQVVLEAESLIHYYLAGRAQERIVGDELFTWARLADTLRRLWALDQAVVIRFGDPLDPLDPAVDARHLGAALTRAYRRDTVFMATHVAGRALYELALQRAGATDIQQLLRHDARKQPLTISTSAAHEAIGRVTALIRGRPEQGRLHRDVDGMTAEAVLASALAAWGTWHRVPPALRVQGQLQVGDASLLFFYRNRSNHVAAAAAAAAAAADD